MSGPHGYAQPPYNQAYHPSSSHSTAPDPYGQQARAHYSSYDPRQQPQTAASSRSHPYPVSPPPSSSSRPSTGNRSEYTAYPIQDAASYGLPDHFQYMSVRQQSSNPASQYRDYDPQQQLNQQRDRLQQAYSEQQVYQLSAASRSVQQQQQQPRPYEAARTDDPKLHPQRNPNDNLGQPSFGNYSRPSTAASSTSGGTESQMFDPEAYRSVNRPVSSSASGIISLYTEDTVPLQISTPASSVERSLSHTSNFHIDPRGHSPASAVPSPVSARFQDSHQSSQRTSRPLPITPTQQQQQQQLHQQPSPSTEAPWPSQKSPTWQSFVTTGFSEFGIPAHSDNEQSRSPSMQANNAPSYFGLASPQPSASSQPTTPSGTYHSTTSSISSRTYPAPAWSPSASAQGTPGSTYGHRQLPSTGSGAMMVDRSFSPPIPERSNASPLSSFRSPSQSQAHPRYVPPSANSFRKESFSSQGHRVASISQMSTQDSDYDPDISNSAGSYIAEPRRQRTQSDASGLSHQPTKSKRQPLPPLPALPSVHMASLHSTQIGMPPTDQISSQARHAPVSSEASSRPLQYQPSGDVYNRAPRQEPSAVDVVNRRPSSSGNDVWQMHQAKGHDRYDSLAWEPVNVHDVLGKAGSVAPRQRWESNNEVAWSLLSTVALLLRANVPRDIQVKGSIDYPKSFTGKDVVSTLQELLMASLQGSQRDIIALGNENKCRQIALLLAKSLKSQLFFHEVDWGENELNDGVDEVYTFLEDSLAVAGGLSNEDPDDWTAGLAHNKLLDSSLQLSISGADESKQRRKKATTTASDLDELPTGVFTPLTRCYSPLCSATSPYNCYSPSCPRSSTSRFNDLISGTASKVVQNGQTAASAQAADQSQKKAWAELVPPELLKSIPQAEIARQNAILETIQKEEEFLSDLELLDSLFVKGLLKPSDAGDPPPLPIGPERETFIREVFGNHLELAAHIRLLVERLHIRQREESPIIQTIGDIFLGAALEWGDTYIAYLVNYPLAISRVKREMAINPRFKAFVEACRRHPAAHKHPLENFLFRPPARLQRYHLHLESILKKTEEGNQDSESLQHAIEIINDQCKTAQAGVEAAELKVKIREYAYNLSAKRNKNAIDMDLLNSERQLVHQGRVLRKPDAFDFDWTELLAILFDNYFIVTKQKRVADGPEDDNSNTSSAGARFVLAKRPIPVEMLEVSGLSDAPISRSVGLSSFHLSRERENRDFWPFTVYHLGGKVEPMTLYAPSKEARVEWKKKLDEAVGLRMAVQDSNKVFDQHMLSDDVFAIATSLSLEPERPVPGVDPSVFHGRVTCAVPFLTADGRRLVAVGCADGVWIGLRSDPKSLRKVLHLKFVTQCAVLESFGIFVVLADKVLISYSLEALVPTTSSDSSSLRPPQKLSGNRDVLFFNVGVLKDRTLLIYMKKKANESVFRALEPVLNAPRTTEGKSGSGFFGKFGKDSKNSDWFRIYKTFFIPSEAYSIQFLKSKLCIICAKGFEIMNLDSLLPGTIPDFLHAPRDDPRVLQLQKRVETAKPLGMFKTLDGDFLLCYDAFACYVDRLGEPIRLDQIIEWEGFPKQVAFSGLYVMAFDHRFIEIRDTQTGRLVQIIRGSDLRYISGNSTITSTSSETASYTALDADVNPVIFTKRERASGRIAFDFQRVVELTPTGPPIPPTAYSTPFGRSGTIMSNSSRGSGPTVTHNASTAPPGWI